MGNTYFLLPQYILTLRLVLVKFDIVKLTITELDATEPSVELIFGKMLLDQEDSTRFMICNPSGTFRRGRIANDRIVFDDEVQSSIAGLLCKRLSGSELSGLKREDSVWNFCKFNLETGTSAEDRIPTSVVDGEELALDYVSF
jgi:hypothetical protein